MADNSTSKAYLDQDGLRVLWRRVKEHVKANHGAFAFEKTYAAIADAAEVLNSANEGKLYHISGSHQIGEVGKSGSTYVLTLGNVKAGALYLDKDTEKLYFGAEASGGTFLREISAVGGSSSASADGFGVITKEQMNSWPSADTYLADVCAQEGMKDTLGTGSALGGKYHPAYIVTSSNKTFGLLSVFGDGMSHGIYEVIETPSILESDGSIVGTHTDGVFHRYRRFFSASDNSESVSGIAEGQWGKWEEDEGLTASEKQRVLDSAFLEFAEYETSSAAPSISTMSGLGNGTVVYNSDSKSFLFKQASSVPGGTPTYYASFVGSAKYGTAGSSGVTPSASKFYLCAQNGQLYHWDGNNAGLVLVNHSASGSGMTAEQAAMLAAHEEMLNPISVSLVSSNGALIENDGTAKTTDISYSASKKDGSSVSLTNVVVKKDGTVLSSLAAVPITGNHTFSLTANANGKDVSKTLGVTYIAARYYGGSTSAAISTEAEIKALEKLPLSTSASYSISMSKTSTFYLWLCVPSSMSVHGVTSGGFDVPMNAPTTVTALTGTYKCYRSANLIKAGTHSFAIS